MSDTGVAFLGQLERVIAERRDQPAAGSYTAELLAAGPARIAQKVGEEAIELALASVSADRDEVIGEAADLLYHLLVLLARRGIRLDAVTGELARRHGRARDALRSPAPPPEP